ncbi:Na-translocating system protein MpsC family protein [Patulibacter sp.]|uniref:Na-translocating system protein MpsC family protein n=1 Tax=Patulibacter sp. TaxID=1912859 RepID=UPI002721E5E6|nr:Na-translocating system protein MpsC family protein [Patulibacter sp.]MDO9406798.1 Na-translocating system protein MpsC family protein [Patulibacter sp.]
MSQLETQSSAVRSPLQSVADVVARHFKEQFGRGPQRCRAFFAGRDAVVVILDGTMSPAERRISDMGQGELVRATRSALQSAVRADVVRAVEEVVGRPVLHAVDGLDVDGDVATQLFVLSDTAGAPPATHGDAVSAPGPAG